MRNKKPIYNTKGEIVDYVITNSIPSIFEELKERNKLNKMEKERALEDEPKECVHDIVTKFGIAECQNCGLEESEILSISKQETIEEAAERIYPTTIDSFTDTGIDMSEAERLIFINGAKWQAERMFSEEDMKEAIRFGFDKGFCSNSSNKVKNNLPSEKEWFEQFKKK
jgi:hypothetical protein